MPFPKGKSGNPKGRRKGAQNRETRRIRLWVDKYLDGNTKQMEEDLKKLSPKDRLNIILGLMEYSVPKLQRTEMDLELDTDKLQSIPIAQWAKEAQNGADPKPKA